MKLRLKYQHSHAGIIYTAGSVIDVDTQSGAWLLKHDRAEEIKDAKRPERKEKE